MEPYLNQEKLTKLHEVQLELLIEFDRICKDHNLVYQLYSGTLLGAVRHKGFIPWDDDLDVCMLRDDYEKFLMIYKSNQTANYFLQTHKTDEKYVHSFARLQKNGTTLVQKQWTHTGMSSKIFIDIFPLDDVNPNSLFGKLQYHLVYQFKRIKRIRRSNDAWLQTTKSGKLKRVLQKPLKMLPMHWFNSIETLFMTMLNGKEKQVSLLTDGGKETYLPYMVEKDTFYNVTNIEFEGHEFLAPANYEEILSRNFGDFMELPPEDKRSPHHGIIELEF